MLPVLLRVGPFALPTYGVLAAAAWLAGILWIQSRRREMGLTEDDVWNAAYWVFAGAFIGGKLLYWVVSSDPVPFTFESLRFGFVFYGGFIGALASGWVFCRRNGFSFARLSDWFAAAAALGHGIGRLGCLAAGCCYGRPTDLPWGIILTGTVPRHPTQVYESVTNIFLFFLMTRFAIPRVTSGRWRQGGAMLFYIAVYAVVRFNLEFFRGDARGAQHWGLSTSQVVAVIAILAVTGLAGARRIR